MYCHMRHHFVQTILSIFNPELLYTIERPPPHSAVILHYVAILPVFCRSSHVLLLFW